MKKGEEKSAEQRGTYDDDNEILKISLQILSYFSLYSGNVSIANDKHDITVNTNDVK